MKQEIAVIGARSLMGQALLAELAVRRGPLPPVHALDSPADEDEILPFAPPGTRIQEPDSCDFRRIGVVFLCLPAVLSDDVAAILNRGCFVIDCSGIVAAGPGIVAGLNEDNIGRRRLILNPTDLTTVLCKVLNPLCCRYDVRGVSATAFRSVGCLGPRADRHFRAWVRNNTQDRAETTDRDRLEQILDLIPNADPNGIHRTESQIKEILNVPVCLNTCWGPPTGGEVCHLTVRLKRPSDIEDICAVWRDNPTVYPVDSAATDLPSARSVAGTDTIVIGRPRSVPFSGDSVHFWVVYDVCRVGSIHNALCLAEHLLT